MRSFVLCLTAVLIPLALYAGPDGHATVNSEAVPLHAEASTRSAVARVLAKGDELKVEFTLATGEGEWCSATGGYVLCRYLTREEVAQPEFQGAPLPPVFTAAVPTTRPAEQTPYVAPREGTLLTPEHSALMSAARLGNVVAIQFAIEKGADVNSRDKDGKTALMWAAYMGRAQAVVELVSAGAEVNAADSTGWTALEAAVWTRRSSVVEVLIERGAQVNVQDNEGRTPLMHAAQYGDAVVMRALLARGADPNARNRFGQTPLMFAAALNDTATARMLLDAGADVNARDAAGRSVLINAALAGDEHTANVQLLIERGAEVNCKDSEGRSALTWADKRRYLVMAHLLRKAGAAD